MLPSSVKISSRYYFTSVPAKVIVNRELRAGGDGSTRHIEVDIRNTSLTYTSADNLGICAENAPAAVSSLAKWMGYDEDAWFTLRRADTDSGRSAKPIFPTPCTVREALTRYCDLNGTVRKDFLGQLANFATNEAQVRARVAEAEVWDTCVCARAPVLCVCVQRVTHGDSCVCEGAEGAPRALGVERGQGGVQGLHCHPQALDV